MKQERLLILGPRQSRGLNPHHGRTEIQGEEKRGKAQVNRPVYLSLFAVYSRKESPLKKIALGQNVTNCTWRQVNHIQINGGPIITL